ncbi:MAG: ShlB/FhaC/HecB family hemolysin secretion/activation protein [Pseudomonadota bacterium]
MALADERERALAFGMSRRAIARVDFSSSPEGLFHGTAMAFLDAIFRDGLQPGRRRYVPLSRDPRRAIAVGRRHGRPVVLAIAAGVMHRAGHGVHWSDNGVWLIDHVSPEYLAAHMMARALTGNGCLICCKEDGCLFCVFARLLFLVYGCWGSFSGQYGFDALHGNYQFSLGGVLTVRGSKSAVVSGSSGWLMRHALFWTAPGRLNASLGAVQVYGGVDFGRIVPQAEIGSAGGGLSGAGFGLKTTGGTVTLALSYNELLSVPAGTVKPGDEVLISVSVRF